MVYDFVPLALDVRNRVMKNRKRARTFQVT
jgi:hypothetical protein